MDPEEISSTVIECMNLCCKKLTTMGISSNEIKAIGLTNQRGFFYFYYGKKGKWTLIYGSKSQFIKKRL